MDTFVETTPWDLLKQKYSLFEVVEYQSRLLRKGQSLWGWPQFAYLHGVSLGAIPLRGSTTFTDSMPKMGSPMQRQVQKKNQYLVTWELAPWEKECARTLLFPVGTDINGLIHDACSPVMLKLMLARYKHNMRPMDIANKYGLLRTNVSGQLCKGRALMHELFNKGVRPS